MKNYSYWPRAASLYVIKDLVVAIMIYLKPEIIFACGELHPFDW